MVSAARLLLIATWTLIHILIMFRYVLSYSLRFWLLLDVLNMLNLNLKYMLWRDIWSDKCIDAELDSITNIAWWLQLSYYLWLKLTQWRRAKTSLCCVGNWYDYYFFIIVIVILNSSFSWSMFSPFGRHPFNSYNNFFCSSSFKSHRFEAFKNINIFMMNKKWS